MMVGKEQILSLLPSFWWKELEEKTAPDSHMGKHELIQMQGPQVASFLREPLGPRPPFTQNNSKYQDHAILDHIRLGKNQ